MAEAGDYRSGVLVGATLVLEQLTRSAAACTEEVEAALAAGDHDRANQLRGGVDAMTAFVIGFSQRLRELQATTAAQHRETMLKELTGGAVEVTIIANENLPHEEDGLRLMQEQVEALRQFAATVEAVAKKWRADLAAGIRMHTPGGKRG